MEGFSEILTLEGTVKYKMVGGGKNPVVKIEPKEKSQNHNPNSL